MDKEVPATLTPVRWRSHDIAAARAVLAQLDQLRTIPAAELDQVAALCTVRAYEPDTMLVVQGAVSHTLLIILQGSASVSSGASDGQPALLSMLGRGDVCGEGGLFGMRYRRVSVRAETRVYALQIQYRELRPLLGQLPHMHAQLRHSFRDRLLQTTLAHVPLFTDLDPLARLQLSAELGDQYVERGDTMLRMGDTHQALHVVAEGQAQVIREGVILNVLGPGDLFGEIELVSHEPYVADVVALTPLHVLTIPLETFRQLLRDHPNLATSLSALANERYATGRDAERVAVLAGAVRSGLVRGRQVLARVPAMCPPDCHLCEQGCGARFGQPRIRIGDTQLGTADVLGGCKHCMWSPECVEACPEDALKLNDAGFLHVNDRCTGCGACADACPYDAITMIPLYPPLSGPLDWLMRRVKQPEPLRLHANKCDGCHGYQDQACMVACPTGSLRWINLHDVLPHGYEREEE